MTEAGTRAARALDDLYRQHVGEIYRYAYAVLGNHADAEDVTQTTFVNALRALERGQQPRKPGNWLLTIAHNVIRQRWRHELARPIEVELDGEVAGPEAGESARPPLGDVVRALQRIPPTQREAIVMRELEGRSYKEIAGILGLTVSALETLLFRARKSLAEELEHLVTCDQAELAVSRRLDERLSRKERRRLDAHLRECPSCARFEAGSRRHRGTLRGLAVLPLPLSLAFWKGAPSAAASASVPVIGLGAGATGGGAAAAGAGGLALGGGLALKAAAVVAAVGVAGGVSYEGVKQVQERADTRAPVVAPTPRASAVARAKAASASALATPRQIPGKALGVRSAPQATLHGKPRAAVVRQAGARGNGRPVARAQWVRPPATRETRSPKVKQRGNAGGASHAAARSAAAGQPGRSTSPHTGVKPPKQGVVETTTPTRGRPASAGQKNPKG